MGKNISCLARYLLLVKQAVNLLLLFSRQITASAAAAATLSPFCVPPRWLPSKRCARVQILIPLSLLFDVKKKKGVVGASSFCKSASSEGPVWLCRSSLDHRADFQSGASHVFYFTLLITALGDLKFPCCHFQHLYLSCGHQSVSGATLCD